jgi:hypothetical protein
MWMSRRRQCERQRSRRGTLERMSYAVEWFGGGVVPVYAIVLLLLIVPEFAAIAVVVATIVVLLGLVALAAAALASPYLLVRSVRRRLRQTKKTMYPLAGRDPGADRPSNRVPVLGRAHVTAFAHDQPDEAGAILEAAARDAA